MTKSRWTLSVTAALTAILLPALCRSLPPEILSDFSNDEEGWTAVGGSVIYHEFGGYRDGFLEFQDTAIGDGYIVAPPRFLGDLREYITGCFRVQLKTYVGIDGVVEPIFGRMEIRSGTLVIAADMVAPAPVIGWIPFTLLLELNSWGGDVQEWRSLLSNVTEIRIYLDVQTGLLDRAGIDEIHLQPGEIANESWTWGAIKGLYGR